MGAGVAVGCGMDVGVASPGAAHCVLRIMVARMAKASAAEAAGAILPFVVRVVRLTIFVRLPACHGGYSEPILSRSAQNIKLHQVGGSAVDRRGGTDLAASRSSSVAGRAKGHGRASSMELATGWAFRFQTRARDSEATDDGRIAVVEAGTWRSSYCPARFGIEWST